jgi:DNA-binding NarL/FixJ family response regulator
MRIALRAGLVETEVVRRRAAALVPTVTAEARVHGDFVAASRLTAYIVAPVVADDRVIGLVHATTRERVLTSVDRDMTRLFVDRFGRAYEGAVIAERVERLRERLRLALDPEDEGVALLDPTVIRFARASTSVAALTPVRALSAAAEDRGEDALTPREHEILALLATGATNLQIADQLVLSESTVKSHVKRILRKLPAANRAEAAYRYLRTATPAGALS